MAFMLGHISLAFETFFPLCGLFGPRGAAAHSRIILNGKLQLIRFCPFHFRLVSCVALVAWKFMGPKSLAPLEFSFKAQHRLFCTILGFLRTFLRQVEGLSPDRRPRYLVFVCADILCKSYKSFIMFFFAKTSMNFPQERNTNRAGFACFQRLFLDLGSVHE